MSKCELYKDTQITFRVYGNIYTAGMKMVYQTFNNKVIEVFYDGEWYPAKVIGKPSERKMIRVNNDLLCSFDLLIKTNNGKKFVKDLQHDDVIEINSVKMDKISYNTNRNTTLSTEITDIESSWLFGVEFLDDSNIYYTITNGMIIASK